MVLSAMTEKEENLIGPNPRDLALLKVMELQKDPASIKNNNLCLIYLKTFEELAENFFGLNQRLVRTNFDQKTIKGLEELIIQKAKKWSFATQVFMYCVPLLGWIAIPIIKYPVIRDMECHLSYRFLHVRKKLKKRGIDPMGLLIENWGIAKKEQ